MHIFPDTTLLITHYNRSSSLERLLKSFEDLNCQFGDIVVSDDGSKPEHLDRIRAMKVRYQFNLVTTPVNRGLGDNINKGQEAVKTPYTLYVQEDFKPREIFPAHFEDALAFMNEDPQLDIVRFYAYFSYPNLKPFKKGFSEMVYSFWDMNHIKFYYYSDHPHLRRSDFLQKFGKYPVGLNVNVTEFKMALSFLKKKGKGLFFNEFTTLFDQLNSSQEPSTFARADWKLSSNPFIKLSRLVYLRYRWLKNTVDLMLTK
ncbi:glycosyltransferase [Dyadobacter sp. CY347]|uniref:glycosyltransferase family 2 protein n=1 Tax=Dyadobacter sp. CY347 TaxID=2909336 RepID=UPI001F2ACAD7|nr:glycosyltransferase [Dyadobacter sp. CY347]MCF2488802.1 glycosyltransferase [Dyadobacter sp. CY347]